VKSRTKKITPYPMNATPASAIRAEPARSAAGSVAVGARWEIVVMVCLLGVVGRIVRSAAGFDGERETLRTPYVAPASRARWDRNR
jgi:hypothetical protein